MVDAYKPQIRALLAQYPRMPGSVIAERIGWPYTLSPSRIRLREIRPQYLGIDPVGRVSYEPGAIT